MVGEGSAGAGGKLTLPSGVVKRLRVGSTDCVGLTSRHLTRARTRRKFSPRPSFGLFQRFMRLQVSVCVYVRVLLFRVLLPRYVAIQP